MTRSWTVPSPQLQTFYFLTDLKLTGWLRVTEFLIPLPNKCDWRSTSLEWALTGPFSISWWHSALNAYWIGFSLETLFPQRTFHPACIYCHHTSVSHSVCLYLNLSLSLLVSIWISVSFSVSRSVSFFVSPFLCLSRCPSLCLPHSPSLCVSLCLSVYLCP